jgi:predicted RNase H-like HicB family nuclease
MNRRLTAIVEREGDGYVAHCPELDVASQGDSVAEARNNLAQALTLFFETASAEEIERRCTIARRRLAGTRPGRSTARPPFGASVKDQRQAHFIIGRGR